MRCVACGSVEERGGSAFCRVCGGALGGGPRPAHTTELVTSRGTQQGAAPTVVEDPVPAPDTQPSGAVQRVLEARLEPGLPVRLAFDAARLVTSLGLFVGATHALAPLRYPLGTLLSGLLPGEAVREAAAFVVLAALASGSLTYGVFRVTSRRWRNVR